MILNPYSGAFLQLSQTGKFAICYPRFRVFVNRNCRNLGISSSKRLFLDYHNIGDGWYATASQLPFQSIQRWCSSDSNQTNPYLPKLAGRAELNNIGEHALVIETGALARFADGCAVVHSRNSSSLVTVVSSQGSNSLKFLPLVVDYRTKGAAAGRIPTNYLRRELGPSDQETLTSRLIDRSVRPLFPVGYSQSTQIICNTLAMDGVTDPVVLALNGASAALALSDIPWNGPIGAVRLGMRMSNGDLGSTAPDDNMILVNPDRQQLAQSHLDMIVVGNMSGRVLMIEMSGKQVPIEVMKRAIAEGAEAASSVAKSIWDLASSIGKPKREWEFAKLFDEELIEKLRQDCGPELRNVFSDSSYDKLGRDNAVKKIRTHFLASDESIRETYPEFDNTWGVFVKELFRELIFETNVRCDGRRLDEVRPIACQADLYQPLHGSALFQRGQSQVLSSVTFDSPDSAFRGDALTTLASGVRAKNFMLHYEFPPFATNETVTPGKSKRRELGHGALAEKALLPLIPSEFPFTIRLTSEVLESNGSTSMAAVCGGSMALMDAGVNISSPVAGVAIGLVTKTADYGSLPADAQSASSGDYSDHRILTDLLGIEDYMGDMDFKIAGTPTGLTAIQLDLKIPGIPLGFVNEALDASSNAFTHILGIMAGTISEPRPDLKENGPLISDITVPIHKRTQFVGVGGRNLKKIQVDYGVTITPIDNIKFSLFAPNRDAMTEAKAKIDQILVHTSEPELEFGAVYSARVTEIRDRGIMVQLFPEMAPVLVPNSQLNVRTIGHASALDIKEGQFIKLKYFGRDKATGRIRLSKKLLQRTGAATPIRKHFEENAERLAKLGDIRRP